MTLFDSPSAKVALTSIFSEVTLDETGPRGLEAITIIDHLGCDVIRSKGKKYQKYDFVKDTKEIDLLDYEKIYIQCTPVNFMGGQYSRHSVDIIEALGNYPGEVVWLITDPMIVPKNPCGEFKRFNVHFSSEVVDHWDDIIENGTYSFGGRDIKKFIGFTPNKVVKDDLFLMTFARKFGQQDLRYVDVYEKEYDLVYYGALREGSRRKAVRTYMSEGERNLLIGYKDPKCKADFIKRVKHKDLLEKVGKSLLSLIVGDKTHNDNIATFRLYETLASDTLCAIDVNYDPTFSLIQDEVLKYYLYIACREDVEDLCSKLRGNIDLYNELLNRQKHELNRMIGSCTNSL